MMLLRKNILLQKFVCEYLAWVHEIYGFNFNESIRLCVMLCIGIFINRIYPKVKFKYDDKEMNLKSTYFASLRVTK